jgi:hypothetical protein
LDSSLSITEVTDKQSAPVPLVIRLSYCSAQAFKIVAGIEQKVFIPNLTCSSTLVEITDAIKSKLKEFNHQIKVDPVSGATLKLHAKNDPVSVAKFESNQTFESQCRIVKMLNGNSLQSLDTDSDLKDRIDQTAYKFYQVPKSVAATDDGKRKYEGKIDDMIADKAKLRAAMIYAMIDICVKVEIIKQAKPEKREVKKKETKSDEKVKGVVKTLQNTPPSILHIQIGHHVIKDEHDKLVVEEKGLGIVALFDVNLNKLPRRRKSNNDKADRKDHNYINNSKKSDVRKSQSDKDSAEEDEDMEKRDDSDTVDSPSKHLRSNDRHNIKVGSSYEHNNVNGDEGYNNFESSDDSFGQYEDDDDKETSSSDNDSDNDDDENQMNVLHSAISKLEFDVEILYWLIFMNLLKTSTGRNILAKTSVNCKLYFRRNTKVYLLPVDAQVENEEELLKAIRSSPKTWSNIEKEETEATVCFSLGITASKTNIDSEYVIWLGNKIVDTANNKPVNDAEFNPEEPTYESFSQGVHSTSKGLKHKELEDPGTAVKGKKAAEESRTNVSISKNFLMALLSNDSDWNDLFHSCSHEMVERWIEYHTIMNVGKAAIAQATANKIDFSSTKQPDIPDRFCPFFEGPGWVSKFPLDSDIQPKVSDIQFCS